MTYTKADIVKNVIEQVHLKRREKIRQQYLFPELDFTPLSKRQAARIVDSMFEIMKGTLERGEHILISGFGKLYVQFKWARKGRNPRTGEEIFLKSRRKVLFRSSTILRDRINRS